MKNKIAFFCVLFILVLNLISSESDIVIKNVEELMAVENYKKALEVIENFEKKYVADIDILYLKGQVFIFLNKHKEANNYFEKVEGVLKDEEVDIPAFFFYQKGVIFSGLKNYEEAIKFLAKAEKKDKNITEVYLEQAEIYILLEKIEEAKICLNRYIKIEKDEKLRKLAIDELKNLKIEEALKDGIKFFESENYLEALNVFNRAYKIDSEDKDVNYFLGKTYGVMKDYRKALFHFEKSKKLGIEKNVDFEIGMFALYTNKEKKAKDSFSKYGDNGENNEFADFSKNKIKELDKDLRIFLTLGTGYDSNVFSFGNDFVDIFSNNNDESAWALFFELHANYELLEEKDRFLNLGFKYYSKYYEDFSELNTQSLQFFVTTGYNIHESLLFEVTANYEYVFLDTESYQSRFSFSPSLTYELYSWSQIVFSYNYIFRNDFTNNFFNELNRSGPLNSLGISKEFFLSEIGLGFGISYSFFENSPEGEDHEYKSHVLSLSLSYKFPFEIYLSSTFSYFFTKYENGNLLLEGERDDKKQNLIVNLNKKILENVNLFVNFDYTRNSSEKEFGFELFDYNRYYLNFGITVSY